MEVNQSPSLSLDTEVDIKVKERVITDTFQLLGIVNPENKKSNNNNTNNSSNPSNGYWRIYPTKKNTESFAKFFCFPFPEDLFDSNQHYLDTEESAQLLALLSQQQTQS